MTNEEAIMIIEKVIQAHWPNWKFAVEETAVWVQRLRNYDYNRAKTAINNFYMRQTRQGKPPPANLLMALRKNARLPEQTEKTNEPVPLFEIIKKDRKRGQRFFWYLKKQKPDNQVIEDYSERQRKNFNNLYGGEHYVVRHWEEVPF